MQPWGRMGKEKGITLDAFWEREVSSRWREGDTGALEIVHFLLAQVMIRHSLLM